MPTPSPMHVASMAQNFARHSTGSNARIFETVALCSMVVMAAAAVAGVGVTLLRELKRHDERTYRSR